MRLSRGEIQGELRVVPSALRGWFHVLSGRRRLVPEHPAETV